MLIVVCVDGVLSGQGHLPQVPSTLLGHSIYDSFPEVSLGLLSSSDVPKLAVEQWLLQEGYTRWNSLSSFGDSTEADPITWKIKAVQAMQAANHKVTFYIDADPESVQAISAIGVPSLLVVPPDAIPRYDGQYRPWNQLTAEIQERRQRQADIVRRQLE